MIYKPLMYFRYNKVLLNEKIKTLKTEVNELTEILTSTQTEDLNPS